MQEKTDCGSVRIQGSSGTPVISAAEFTFTQGPWLSPKDSEASAWQEAAPLPQKPDSLTISLNKTLAAWQQLPGFQGRCWDAPRVAFMHRSITRQREQHQTLTMHYKHLTGAGTNPHWWLLGYTHFCRHTVQAVPHENPLWQRKW